MRKTGAIRIIMISKLNCEDIKFSTIRCTQANQTFAWMISVGFAQKKKPNFKSFLSSLWRDWGAHIICKQNSSANISAFNVKVFLYSNQIYNPQGWNSQLKELSLCYVVRQRILVCFGKVFLTQTLRTMTCSQLHFGASLFRNLREKEECFLSLHIEQITCCKT